MILKNGSDGESPSAPAGEERFPNLKRGGSMRRILLKAHLYGGLVTCWYLLVYGWSSLGFNHPWLLPSEEGTRMVWESQVKVARGSDDLQTAEAIRNRLGLIGWPLPWTMERDAENVLFFEIARPGKHYGVRYFELSQRVSVTENSTGLGSVVRSLHGMGHGIPNSSWMSSWAVYTEITTWVALLAIGSGVYLWLKRSERPLMAVTWTILAVIVSVSLMVYAVRIG